jgi:hypothetical protein
MEYRPLFLILCIGIAVLFNSCGKIETNECNSNFAIAGQLLDGRTGIPVDGVVFTLFANKKDIVGSNNYQVMSFGKITHNGEFSLGYKCNTNFTSMELQFNVDSPYIIANEHLDVFYNRALKLPVNSNISNLKYYMCDSGTLRLFVKNGQALKPTDTLMVQILNTHLEIKAPVNGLIDSFRMPAFSQLFIRKSVYWGIGKNQLNAALKLSPYGSEPHKIDFDILGDPYPTDITISL